MANPDSQLRKAVAAGVGDGIETALTAATADAPAGGSGATGGAYDTSGNRDTMIALVNNNKTRIGEIEAALEKLGVLKN